MFFSIKAHIDKVYFETDNFLELLASKTECFLIHDGVRFFKIKRD